MNNIQANQTAIHWLHFDEHQHAIENFRHQVYVQEQGICPTKASHNEDENALHLAAFIDDQLVSIISAFIETPADKQQRPIIRYGMRIENKSIRGSGLSELLCIHMCLCVYETIRPTHTYIRMLDAHMPLAQHYRNWGFTDRPQTTPEYTDLACIGDPLQFAQYQIGRQKLQGARLEHFENKLPSLLSFLQQHQRGNLIALKEIRNENLYTQGVNVDTDLPRLTSQAQFLYQIEKPIIDKLQKRPRQGLPRLGLPKKGSLIDLGAGAGIYLDLLSKHPLFADYQCHGLDSDRNFHHQAKQQFADINWHLQSIYDTQLPDNSIDFAHASLVFIHLSNPQLALQEIKRLLNDNGLLMVVDVNDSTYEGPDALAQVLQAYGQQYQGNRNVFNQLDKIANRCGFNCEQQHLYWATNKQHPAIENTAMVLDNATLLSMFDFIGENERFTDSYQQVKQQLLLDPQPLRMGIQTHIYRSK